MQSYTQNQVTEWLAQNNYCECFPSRSLSLPFTDFNMNSDAFNRNSSSYQDKNVNFFGVNIHPMRAAEQYDVEGSRSLNNVAQDLQRSDRAPYNTENFPLDTNIPYQEIQMRQPTNFYDNVEVDDNDEMEDEFDSIIDEADKIKIKPIIYKDNQVSFGSEEVTNPKSLHIFKSMIGASDNCFSMNSELVDSKNPAKVINPHGMALQISTSDIPTIKSILKYAAENGQEVTVVIPMRKTKNVTACPHYDRKHYAKNMCSACYNKSGRTKKAWACGHPNKVHYAKGLCQFCYLAKYHKDNSTKR